MKRRYNPYYLPEWLRKPRFNCKAISIPITCFQLIRVVIVLMTGDFLLFLFQVFFMASLLPKHIHESKKQDLLWITPRIGLVHVYFFNCSNALRNASIV